MANQEIQEKVKQLKAVMAKYKKDHNALESELFKVINEYQKALEEEKLKELRQTLSE